MDIHHLRDFLQVYNRMTETCFSHCVNTFGDRKITEDEEKCAEFCANKLLCLNRRIMEVYIEVQPKFMKKMEESVAAVQNKNEPQSQIESLNQNNETSQS